MPNRCIVRLGQTGEVRIVLFTTLDIESTDWWPVVMNNPGLDAVLICRKTTPNDWASVARRFGRNVRKHGLIFVPYRIYRLVRAIAGRLFRHPTVSSEERWETRVTRIESNNIHFGDTLSKVREWGPDLGLSIGAPILKPSLFTIPVKGTINVHCGKLPDFRGAPPGFWEIFKGARQIGASVHWMNEGLDTGDIIEEAVAHVYENDGISDVESRAVEMGRSILSRVLAGVSIGETSSHPQAPGGCTFKQPLVSQRIKVQVRNALRRYGYWNSKPGHWPKMLVSILVLTVLRPLRDLWRTATARHPVRVFNFHRVTDLCRDGMTVSPAVFERQVQYVMKHHRVIPAGEAVELIKSSRGLRRACAVLTFDDGYRSVFNQARPIMKRAGIVGCCFVPTDMVDTDRRFQHDLDSSVQQFLDVMGWDELRCLQAQGWEIGAHSATHARLSELDEERLAYEVTAPIEALRENLGSTDLLMAYPFGQADDVPDNWRPVVREAGYGASFTDMPGENFPGSDLFDLSRIELGGDHETLAWKVRVHGVDLSRFRSRV